MKTTHRVVIGCAVGGMVLIGSTVASRGMLGDARQPSTAPFLSKSTSAYIDGIGHAHCYALLGQTVLDPLNNNQSVRSLAVVVTADVDFEPGYPFGSPRLWLVDTKGRESRDTGWVGKAPDGQENYRQSDFTWLRATVSAADNKTWGEVQSSDDLVINIDLEAK